MKNVSHPSWTTRLWLQLRPSKPAMKKKEAAEAVKKEASKAGDTGTVKDEGKAEADDEDDDSESDDDGAGDFPVKGKPSMRRPAAALSAAKRMKAGPASASPKATAKAPVAKPGNIVFKPSYGIEESRNQVQCRTGLKTIENRGVIAPCFKFKKFANGKAGAIKAAKKWLDDFKKNNKCA